MYLDFSHSPYLEFRFMKISRSCAYLIAVAFSMLFVARTEADFLIGLTQSNSLIRFDSATPGMTSTPVNITGLTSGDMLVGIDARPANGLIYGLGLNGTVGRLYTIDAFTGMATLQSTINTPVMGNFFGMSFNPVPDRLRLVSDTGQNLRINVDTGVTLVDGSIAYASGDPNAGSTPMIVASAYTNAFPGATATTLYNIDMNSQSLVTQIPPNDGTLNTVGSLGDIAFPESSFDIVAGSNRGLVVLNGFELLEINLATGNTTFVGAINTPSSLVAFTANAVPEPSSLLLLAMAGSVSLLLRRRRSY
jgi:hypothetical protein